MNKVTTINLNGKAYQVEEAGYAVLKEYLEEADRKLGDIPDKQDVLADFEQAIAEKADKRLNFNKTVLDESEIKQIIKEMGPVEGDESTSSKYEERQEAPSAPKRLYRVREGKVFAGICNGFAAYFGIDVAVVRIIFVLLGLVTQGFAFLLYLVLIFVMPVADTDEKLAAAYGVPFNAKEVLNRAQKEYGAAKQSFSSWKRDRRKQWKEAIRQERMDTMYPYETGGAVFMRAVLGIIATALTIGWIVGMVTLFATGALFGMFWIALPLWATAALFTVLFAIIVSPFSEGRRYGYHGGNGFGTIVLLILAFWALYHFVPESRPVFHRAEVMSQQAADAVREAVKK